MKISPLPASGIPTPGAADQRPTITVKTNVSPDRIESPIPPAGNEPEPVVAEAGASKSATEDPSVEATPASEETKPLSPQFAALAKQRRALQVKEQELAKREQALKESSAPSRDILADLKKQPLRVLQEAGVTYEQLTEAVLADPSNSEIQALREEIKALKEGVDKSLVDRDTQAEQQALAEIGKEVNRLVTVGDAFETIRATKSEADVVELIHRTYKQTGEILTEMQACRMVEDQLLEELLPLTKLAKVQSKLTPPSTAPQQQQPQGMKTLTNRDTSRPTVSRRERAIAAMLGNKRQ